MIKEVAFVAIAVSDKERREILPGNARAKAEHNRDGRRVGRVRDRPRTIGVGCHPDWKPSRDGTTIAFEVDDIDAEIARLKKAGVTFDLEKLETPVCWMAQFRDPDGNKLVVHKRKVRLTNVCPGR
jgi:catechol 2,3-dioxygenase-like lactoylglutathione lyase family enzyme